MSSNNLSTSAAIAANWENSYIAYLNSLNTQLVDYFLLVTVPLGIVGNLVSCLVFATRPRLNNSKTNVGFLYAWLSLVNLLSILYYALVYRSRTLFNYSVDMPCGLDDFLRRTTLNAVPWMQVVISVDRFVVVVYPSKKQFFSKKVSKKLQFKF